MSNDSKQAAYVENVWREYLTLGDTEEERRHRQIFKMLPGYPRCKCCYAPFVGWGSRVVRLVFNKYPSNLNPNLCNICEDFARKHQGGAEIELTLLFVDVRGSTSLAEKMRPKEYSQLINRLYTTASGILARTDALIDKIIGDQVAGMYVPGIAGKEHAKRAVAAAQEIMRETGHGKPGGPWIHLGAGVHTGVAFVGSVGSEGKTNDITVLGDAANTAARLSTAARQGEILISDSAYQQARLDGIDLEERRLDLKGKAQAVSVRVLTDYGSIA
jgi:adenylate cyclase